MIDTLDRPTLDPQGFDRSSPGAARRISWGSIVAGVAVSLAAQLSFGVLGLGLGASALHPSGAASAQSFGIGTACYLFVTTLVALFAGGWVAGRLAGSSRAVESALHGLVVWSLATMLAVYLLTTAIGGLFSGASSLLGSVVGAAGGGIAAAAPSIEQAAGTQLARRGISLDAVTKTVEGSLAAPAARHDADLVRQAASDSASDPEAARRNVNDLVYRVLHDAGLSSSSADRTRLIAIVAERRHVSTDAATKTVDEWQNEARSAQQSLSRAAHGASVATQHAGDVAASGIATTGIAAFFFLLLGAAAAGFGGFSSAPRAPRAARVPR